MKSTRLALYLLALLAGSPAVATEVYRWVDENGVVNFSQSAPPAKAGDAKKMVLEDTTPPDYDPEEDRYGVQAQAERMAALREELAERREEKRERRRNAAAQRPAVQYSDPYRYGRPLFWNPPYYTRPPVRPEPPIAVPYETSTFRPPGLNPN